MLGKYYKTLLLGGCAAAIIAIASPAAAQSTEAISFDIPSQPLGAALTQFAQQSKIEILFSSQLARDQNAPAIRGDMEPRQALAMLLGQSGLRYRATPTGSFVIEAADPQSGSAAGDGADGTVAALIVTAQKREEQIQDVPIAISAFTEKSLDEQKIEGGFDLLKAVPNVTFSKNNFTGYNFSIRGIGTKAVSVTTDPGVAVSFNSVTMIRNRLFEQEYFDVERVEVLRGPQGTLYGRNATAGVINVISAKPDMDEFKGWLKGEVGNYNSKRVSTMVNVPLVEDKLAIRLAGALTIRDGYSIDLYDNSHVDGRDLWSTRVTLAFSPSERLRTNLVWERFREDDDRARTSKQLCTHDAGPTEIGGVIVGAGDPTRPENIARSYFSQGCLPRSLYDDAAFGTPNGFAIPFVLALAAQGSGNCTPDDPSGCFTWNPILAIDPYGNTTQSRDLRAIYSQIKPKYQAAADVVELNVDFDVTDALTLTSQTLYNKDRVYGTQDYNRYTTLPVFHDTRYVATEALRPLIQNGIFCDPQLGCSNTIVGQDLSRSRSEQFSQEMRLQSSWSGPVNFSAGISYTRFKTLEDYYVFFNGITMASIFDLNITFLGGGNPDKFTTNPDCSMTLGGKFGPTVPDGYICVPIEQNPISNISDVGHNYFLSRNPYRLTSGAVFGEVYIEPSDTFKITAGLRYTDDRKTFTPIPSETLLTDPARLGPFGSVEGANYVKGLLPLWGFAPGIYPALPDVHKQWREVTGRLGAEWKPALSFTDQTMVYAFYSRGYKGGGMNPPRIGIPYDLLTAVGNFLPPSAPADFRPEFVNAFELGAKNTLMGGALVANLSAFFYDYKDYQVSKIVDRTANNENFDAKVWGLELEALFQPSRHLRINGSIGYLDTELGDGSMSIDVMNRTAGRSDWVVVKPDIVFTSNCIVPVSVMTKILQQFGSGFASYACPGGALGKTFRGPGFPNSTTLLDGSTYNPMDHPEANFGAGFDTDVSGHELPNSPHWTATLGGQYSFDFLEGWRATVRGDAYWQAQSWARVYELPIDKLHGWYNANLTLRIERPDDGLAFELYAKNILDKTPITDTFTNSDDTALTTNVFVLDPRLIGLSIKKEF